MNFFVRIENEIGGRDENRDREVSSRSPPHLTDAELKKNTHKL